MGPPRTSAHWIWACDMDLVFVRSREVDHEFLPRLQGSEIGFFGFVGLAAAEI